MLSIKYPTMIRMQRRDSQMCQQWSIIHFVQTGWLRSQIMCHPWYNTSPQICSAPTKKYSLKYTLLRLNVTSTTKCYTVSPILYCNMAGLCFKVSSVLSCPPGTFYSHGGQGCCRCCMWTPVWRCCCTELAILVPEKL